MSIPQRGVVVSRSGDDGESTLTDGHRRRKDDLSFEALGDLDELNSFVGLARSCSRGHMQHVLRGIQEQIIAAGAIIADSAQEAKIKPDDILGLEALCQEFRMNLDPVDAFVLPGDTELSARLHVARAVCRRLERRIVTCLHTPEGRHLGTVLRYLNRLSDLLFVFARAANTESPPE